MRVDATCTSEEATAAVGYLQRSFGGFSIPEDEKRAFLRLFATYPPVAVRVAIDELVRTADRRPSPHEVACKLRPACRPAVRDTRNDEPWPEIDPEDVSRRIAELKAVASGVPDASKRAPLAARADAAEVEA